VTDIAWLSGVLSLALGLCGLIYAVCALNSRLDRIMDLLREKKLL
jgi:hypothetical protein